MAIEIRDDDVLLPWNPHPLQFGQAVVVGCLILCDVFGEERDVGEPVEDDLVDVLEFAEGLEAVHQSSFKNDHDFFLDQVHLFNEPIGQRNGELEVCFLLYVHYLKEDEPITANNQLINPLTLSAISLHRYSKMTLRQQLLAPDQFRQVAMGLYFRFQQVDIRREWIVIEEIEGAEL